MFAVSNKHANVFRVIEDCIPLPLQQPRHILANPLLQFSRLHVQWFQFFVQALKAFFEVEIVGGSFGYADVAAGVEAPALRFDLGQGGYFAQARHVGVDAVGEGSPACATALPLVVSTASPR